MVNEIVENINKAVKYIKADAGAFKMSNYRIGIWRTSAGWSLSACQAVNPFWGSEINASVLFFPSGFDFLAPQNDTVRIVLPSIQVSRQLLDSF